MKQLIWLSVLLLIASQVLAADVVTNLVYHQGGSEKMGADPYMSGDLWIKIDEPARINADFDLQFEKNTSKVNVAQIKFMVPQTDIMVGRQQIGWGVGYAVNPIDIINPRPIGSSFDPTFVRDGRDALVVRKYFGSLSLIEVVYAADLSETKDYSGTPLDQNFKPDAGIKVKTNLYSFDIAASYIEKGQRTYSTVTDEADRVWGFEIAGTVPVIEWGIWQEVAYYIDAGKYDAIVGTDYYLGDYHISCEYYKNQFGSADKATYDLTQLFLGRLLAQNYLIPSLSWTVNEKLALTGFAFWNLDDGGVIGGGVVDYFINNNVEFVLMPYALKGGSDTEVGQQKALVGRYGAEAMIKWVF